MRKKILASQNVQKTDNVPELFGEIKYVRMFPLCKEITGRSQAEDVFDIVER
jgi:hypothetical protein